jgi:hypothetical protein
LWRCCGRPGAQRCVSERYAPGLAPGVCFLIFEFDFSSAALALDRLGSVAYTRLIRSCSGFATFKGAISMSHRKSGKSGNRSMTTTHDVRGANGGGRRFSMDRGKSEREFSQGASRTHALNTPKGVSQILGNPMRGGIRL